MRHLGIWLILACLVAAADRTGALGDDKVATGRATPIQGDVTGWFHLQRFGGRDLLVTPDGQAYFAFGINHVADVRSTPYFKSLVPEVGGTPWDRIFADYQAWGFNMVGYGGPDPAVFSLPYVLACTAARTSKQFTEPTSQLGRSSPRARLAWEFPDVWSDSWKHSAETAIAEMSAGRTQDPRLIGYFWTDTPTWDIVKTRGLRGGDWVSAIRGLGGESPGKQRYVAFLGEKYEGRLAELNEYYSLNVAGIPELLDHRFADLPIGRHRVLADDREFLGRIAVQYYETLAAIQKRIDPLHLVFGERFLLGDTPDEVLTAARDYVDVISIQPGDGYTSLYPPSVPFPEQELDRIHQLTRKPILVCDHQISFATAQSPRTTWTQLPDERAAADATLEFILRAVAKPYIVGYMRCQFIDRPAGLGRGTKQGLLNENGVPHPRLLEAHRLAGKSLADVQRTGDSPADP